MRVSTLIALLALLVVAALGRAGIDPKYTWKNGCYNKCLQQQHIPTMKKCYACCDKFYLSHKSLHYTVCWQRHHQ